MTTAPKKRKALTWSEKMAGAKLSERVVYLCVRGDLYSQIEELNRELIRISEGNDARLIGNPTAFEKASEIKALQDEMEEYTERFLYRGLDSRAYTALEKQYPPRPGDQNDLLAGHNRDDFYEALIKKCLVTPEMTDADWDALLPKLQQRQYDELASAAWSANKGDVSIPFSQAASKVLMLGSGLKRQNASESPSEGSTDGSHDDVRLTGTTSKAG